jgi:hypothetical protein
LNSLCRIAFQQFCNTICPSAICASPPGSSVAAVMFMPPLEQSALP